jgi:hypothetical protein
LVLSLNSACVQADTSSTCLFYAHDDPSVVVVGAGDGLVAVAGAASGAGAAGGGPVGYKAIPPTTCMDMHCTKPLVAAADEVRVQWVGVGAVGVVLFGWRVVCPPTPDDCTA